MSIYSRNAKKSKSAADVTAELGVVLAQIQGDMISPENTMAMLGIEGIDTPNFQNMSSTFEAVQTQLENAGLRDHLEAQLMAEGDYDKAHIEERIGLGMEAATLAALSLGNPEQAQKSILQAASAPSNTINIDTFVPGVATAMPDMQAFHNQSFDNWRAETVRMAALNALNSEFIEAFFKTRVMEPNQHGQIVEIKVPYAYTRKRRAANGKAFEGPEKISLLRAAEDPHLLEDFSTDIIPRADGAANNDAFLADAAVVPNVQRTIHGETIETRPLKFGEQIDLLGVSNHPGLLGSAVQTDTDTIESNINLGDLYLKATIDNGGTATDHVFKIDASAMAGALFTPVSEGSNQSLSIAFKNDVAINSNMRTIAGTDAFVAMVESKLGVPAGSRWSIGVQVNLHGTASSEFGNIEVFNNGVKLSDIFVEGSEEPVTGAAQTAIAGDVTFELVGYMPKARRTNVTLRQDGYLLDDGTPSRYYFGLRTGAPISSTRPVSAPGGAANLDVLRRGLRVVSNGNAFNCLFNAEERIRQAHATGVLPASAPTIGGLYVKPYFYEDSIDLQNHIAIQRSGLGYDDARGLLIDTVTTAVDSMLLNSGYLTALENFDGAERDYEVIIGTDPRLAGLLMRSGDARTLGEGRKFRVVSTMHKSVRNKIYISFRRPTQDGVDALSFGAHLYKAPLVHDVPNASHNGGTIAKVQAQPVELYTNTLPVMGIVNVAGVEEYFKR